MDETNALVPDDLDLINQAQPAKVTPQQFFSRVLIQFSEIHDPAGVVLLNRQTDLAWNRGRLSPTNLQLLSVQGQLLDDSVCIKVGIGGDTQEGQEDTRLLGENSSGPKWTKLRSSSVEEVAGRFQTDVTTGSNVGGTESNLEGSRRILCPLLPGT